MGVVVRAAPCPDVDRGRVVEGSLAGRALHTGTLTLEQALVVAGEHR